MEKIGDSALDYLEVLVDAAHQAGCMLFFPKISDPCSDEVMRCLLLNSAETVRLATGGIPTPNTSVLSFLRGGPRPPITG